MYNTFGFSHFKPFRLSRLKLKETEENMLVSTRITRIGPIKSSSFNVLRNPSKGLFVKRELSIFQGVTDLLVSAHNASGIPWLALIPLTTIALRTVTTLPLSIWQRKRIVKQQRLRKLVQAVPPVIKLRLAASTASNSAAEPITSSGSAVSEIHPNDSPYKNRALTPEQITLLAVKETRKRQKRLFARYNVQMWKNMVLPLVQVPLWIALSMGIRTLTEKKLIESNNNEYLSLLSTPTLDLSLPLDSMPMLVPLILGSLALTNVEYNGKMLTSTKASDAGVEVATDEFSKMSQSMRSILNVSRFSCIFMMGISSQAPLLLSLYWISSQLFSFVQNLILNWLWPYER